MLLADPRKEQVAAVLVRQQVRRRRRQLPAAQRLQLEVEVVAEDRLTRTSRATWGKLPYLASR
jgi:hypothetical protein